MVLLFWYALVEIDDPCYTVQRFLVNEEVLVKGKLCVNLFLLVCSRHRHSREPSLSTASAAPMPMYSPLTRRKDLLSTRRPASGRRVSFSATHFPRSSVAAPPLRS